jgi:hypothetical protein
MKILRQNTDLNLVLNQELDFQMNLGWQENMQQFEDEVLQDIINPIDNYETVRYIHKPTNSDESDIWFYFYFSNNGNYYFGLDYSVPQIDITPKENAKMLRQSTESFFRLEFYKTPNQLDVNGNVTGYTAPTRQNRKLVFTKNLTLPLGEKYFYTPLQENIHVPVFHGSNYTNKENMYIFWFQDESVLAETNFSGTTTGNTFFMTAKFFNAKDGQITDFYNDVYSTSHEVKEYEDMYFQVDIDKRDYSYKIYKFNGVKGDEVGTSSSPIKFYESGGGINTSPITPTPTVSVTPTPTPTIGLTPSPTPTPSVTPATPTLTYYWYELTRCDDNSISYSNSYVSGTWNTGERVYSSDPNITYVISGSIETTQTDPSPGDHLTITRSTTVINGETIGLYGCDYVAPPTYRTVKLFAWTKSNESPFLTTIQTDLCGKYPYQFPSDYVGTGALWLNETSVTPYTTYTVWDANIGGQAYNGQFKWYGILLPGESTVRFIVYIDGSGTLQDWTAC